jgi:hypothetical protein
VQEQNDRPVGVRRIVFRQKNDIAVFAVVVSKDTILKPGHHWKSEDSQ